MSYEPEIGEEVRCLYQRHPELFIFTGTVCSIGPDAGTVKVTKADNYIKSAKSDTDDNEHAAIEVRTKNLFPVNDNEKYLEALRNLASDIGIESNREKVENEIAKIEQQMRNQEN